MGIIRVLPNGNEWVRLPDQVVHRLVFQRADFEIGLCQEPEDMTFCLRSLDGPFSLDVDGNANQIWIRSQLDAPIVCLWTTSNFLA